MTYISGSSDFASYFYHYIMDMNHAWVNVWAYTMSDLLVDQQCDILYCLVIFTSYFTFSFFSIIYN